MKSIKILLLLLFAAAIIPGSSGEVSNCDIKLKPAGFIKSVNNNKSLNCYGRIGSHAAGISENSQFLHIAGITNLEKIKLDFRGGFFPRHEDDLTGGIPDKFMLHANYPNPFNPSTTISYDLPSAGMVSIRIYNILGDEVITLVKENMEPGQYRSVWQGRNYQGLKVCSGVYICRLEAGKYSKSIKMLLLK